MNTKLCLLASALMLAAGPAFAQEPLENSGTEPTTQMAPTPNTDPAAKEPLDQAGTAPAEQAASPAAETPEPLAADATADQKSADAPAEVVFTELTTVDDNKKMVGPLGLPADSVAQMDVFDKAGKKIGEVDAVLQDKNGEIKGVAVGYGGFLGFGEKGAIVTLDQMKLKDGALVTDLTEDQLSSQPNWPNK